MVNLRLPSRSDKWPSLIRNRPSRGQRPRRPPRFFFFPPQSFRTFGFRFRTLPFWAVKWAKAWVLALGPQRFSELTISPRLPPKRVRLKLETGASGTTWKVFRRPWFLLLSV